MAPVVQESFHKAEFPPCPLPQEARGQPTECPEAPQVHTSRSEMSRPGRLSEPPGGRAFARRPHVEGRSPAPGSGRGAGEEVPEGETPGSPTSEKILRRAGTERSGMERAFSEAPRPRPGGGLLPHPAPCLIRTVPTIEDESSILPVARS